MFQTNWSPKMCIGYMSYAASDWSFCWLIRPVAFLSILLPLGLNAPVASDHYFSGLHNQIEPIVEAAGQTVHWTPNKTIQGHVNMTHMASQQEFSTGLTGSLLLPILPEKGIKSVFFSIHLP